MLAPASSAALIVALLAPSSAADGATPESAHTKASEPESTEAQSTEAEPESTEPEAGPESTEAQSPLESPEPAPATPVVPDPSPEGGGFGSVGQMQVESNVQAPPPLPPREQADEPESGPELSARVELGYARTDLSNAKQLDHQGLLLRVHFIAFPWVSRRGRVGGGFGAAYTYTGLNRGQLPDPPEGEEPSITRSSAQQQDVTLSVDLLLRPHREGLSMHLSPMFGLGWYGKADELYAAERSARIGAREYAFVGGGALALCTAWDIVCLVGGSRIFVGVTTDSLEGEQTLAPWGWHAGLGVDVVRIWSRANGVPQ